MLTLRPNWLVIASILTVSACAHQPEGPPIVLRKRAPAPHVTKPTRPLPAEPIAPAQDQPVVLSPAEKEELFRAFNSYLDRTAPNQ